MRRSGLVVPPITFPDELPISAHRDEIAVAIAEHQVVVVAGETGSGKTTQLPKICLDIGRGIDGLIGHTQPRRIAARSVAERLAAELGVPVGGAVGYAVRFTDQVGPQTLVKVMTDGILLAELQRDRDLRRYDTVIIDEAHERSLNIDFLLGYLTRLLPRRPDLRLVITSATIDPGRFAEHFGKALDADVPVIEVSGRTYPVEVRYRPLDERDQTDGVVDAVRELTRDGPGDILVFLSGEREIRDTADTLAGLTLPATEILPLYGRLSMAEQHRVFAPHDQRRVVLATNVAETSLTVPGIRYVVDAGTARISRYSARTKVQRLPIEPISQASAHQRAGRCGRLADGICIRLYSEDDYDTRPQFTEPEIQRTGLAAVLLRMMALGLGDVEEFPFVDPPDARQVRDGLALLEELGAIDRSPRSGSRRRGRTRSDNARGPGLTPLGRRLADLPVDPRLGRMLLAAVDAGCAVDVLPVVAALAIQDPRERPADHQDAADTAHRRFATDGSDFLALLRLWQYVREQQDALSSSAFRRMCKREFLHYLRIREWQDLVGQLRQALAGVRAAIPAAAKPGTHPWTDPIEDGRQDAIHQALLTGLLSQVGMREVETRRPGERRRGPVDYVGARGSRFAINPGSELFRAGPEWVMAAELVETTRLWARVCAPVDPSWVERAAGHLVVRSYDDARWAPERGAAIVTERVSLYGLPLVAGRTVLLSRVDQPQARDLFIRHALVQGEWSPAPPPDGRSPRRVARTAYRPPAFWRRNEELRADVAGVEDRVRRRDLLVDDEALVEFYGERIPADVVSVRHFDAWWKRMQRDSPELLSVTRDFLLSKAVGDTAVAYPGAWRQGELGLDVSYRFEPGDPADGVTVHVPVAVLNQVRPDGFDWQVPGFREELATALVRSLPKALRRQLVPAPDRARTALAALDAVHADQAPAPFADALARELTRQTGVRLGGKDFDVSAVPPHLRVGFAVEDESGEHLAYGKELAVLQRDLGARVEDLVGRLGADLERKGMTGFDLPTLPRVIERERGGQHVRGYPALVDEGATVGVRVFATPAEQAAAMRAGTRRLLMAGAPTPQRIASVHLDTAAKLALARSPYATSEALFDDCLACAVDGLIDAAGGPAWDAIAYAKLAVAVRADLAPAILRVLQKAAAILGAAHDAESELARLTAPAIADSALDARAHLGRLLFPGFVLATGGARLADVGRYVNGIVARLGSLPGTLTRDVAGMARVHPGEDAYALATHVQPASPERTAALDDVMWMLEELRVSVFAQRLGTAYPVSEKRVRGALADVPPR